MVNRGREESRPVLPREERNSVMDCCDEFLSCNWLCGKPKKRSSYDSMGETPQSPPQNQRPSGHPQHSGPPLTEVVVVQPTPTKSLPPSQPSQIPPQIPPQSPKLPESPPKPVPQPSSAHQSTLPPYPPRSEPVRNIVPESGPPITPLVISPPPPAETTSIKITNELIPPNENKKSDILPPATVVLNIPELQIVPPTPDPEKPEIFQDLPSPTVAISPIQITSELREKLESGRHRALFHVAPLSKPGSPLHDPEFEDEHLCFVKTALDDTNRWEIISRNLLQLKEECLNGKYTELPDKIADRLFSMMKTYASSEETKSEFAVLEREELAPHLVEVIPAIVDHALCLPQLLNGRIPILKSGDNATLYFTKKLVCSLLANAFFSTFPADDDDDRPDINFSRLFKESGSPDLKREKLMCLLAYFRTMHQESTFDDWIVSYKRRCSSDKQDWANLEEPLINVSVDMERGIEDADGMLQADFANKVVGGGVLSSGCVMEEIRFVTWPELILSRLFTENLADDEVLVVTGIQRFSHYKGYSSSFKFKRAVDLTSQNLKRDNLGRLTSQVVAMDAIKYDKAQKSRQFQPYFLHRELHKAYVAFTLGSHPTPVATGNWGCGVFNGDPQLKFLIQWLAASAASRPMLSYHTIGDRGQTAMIQELVTILKEKEVKIGQLFEIVLSFNSGQHFDKGLFEYIKENLEEASESEETTNDGNDSSEEVTESEETSNASYDDDTDSGPQEFEGTEVTVRVRR